MVVKAWNSIPACSVSMRTDFTSSSRCTFRPITSESRSAMKSKENPWIEICPGIKRRTLTSGKTMYQMRAQLAAGSKMPAHQHPQEQIVHILSGRMKLIVDGTPHDLTTGDSFYLAPNIPHGVET